MEIIRVDKLTKTFRKSVVAVDSVSFMVYEGEIFGFLGPNGAGKTTTIKMLTTVLRPTAGSARVCGFDIARQSTQVRQHISVVPQEYTADEDLSGSENMMLCADLYSINRRKVRDRTDGLLRLMGLDGAKDRKVMTYSGGMRRRLELACGLINQPQLLFLDEPTLGLDMQTRAAVWDYIRLLKTQFSMTVFMTTHYLEEAENLCDRVAIIDGGRIVKLGSPAELVSSLGGDIVLLEISDKEADISPILERLPNLTVISRANGRYRMKVPRADELAALIIDAVRASGHQVSRFSLSKPSLGQAYLEYTGKEMKDELDGSAQVWKHRLAVWRGRE